MFDEITPEEAARLKNLPTTISSRKITGPASFEKLNGFVVNEVIEYYVARNARYPMWLKGQITRIHRDTAIVKDLSGKGPKQNKARIWESIRKVQNAQE